MMNELGELMEACTDANLPLGAVMTQLPGKNGGKRIAGSSTLGPEKSSWLGFGRLLHWFPSSISFVSRSGRFEGFCRFRWWISVLESFAQQTRQEYLIPKFSQSRIVFTARSCPRFSRLSREYRAAEGKQRLNVLESLLVTDSSVRFTVGSAAISSSYKSKVDEHSRHGLPSKLCRSPAGCGSVFCYALLCEKKSSSSLSW